MKLITIGTSRDASIRLSSKYASPIHAELLLLDNGDILLTDKNSNNGTFVQDKRIEPNRDISVRRGDKICFADVYLDWNHVPQMQIADPVKVKGVYGVGSNFRNKYQLTGATVSRYHATFKEMRNGQWFIRDHSRNGTTINGVRLSPEMDYRVKAKDVIVCGGVPCPNPVPSAPIGVVGKIAAVAVVVVAIVFGVKEIVVPSFEDMSTASVMVYGQYHYVAKLKDDPFVGIIPGWPTEFNFVVNPKTQEVEMLTSHFLVSDKSSYGVTKDETIGYTGTAFFVSNDGKMITNRHVAQPWYEGVNDKAVVSEINQKMIEFRNDAFDINELRTYYDYEDLKNTQLGSLIYYILKKIEIEDKDEFFNEISRFNGYFMRFKNSAVEISGELDYIGVAITGHKYSSALEFDRCTVLSVSENSEIDLAMLQLNSNMLPPSVKFVYDINKCEINPKKLKVQEKTYYSIGYDGGLMGLDNLNGGLQPTLHEVKVSKLPGEYNFQLQGEVIGGCSGSPICDRKGHLIGVVWGKSTYVTTMTVGVHAKYVKEMYDRIY